MEKTSSRDILKDPYVLEFLGLEVPAGHSENEFETAIISNLQQFLLDKNRKPATRAGFKLWSPWQDNSRTNSSLT